MSSDQNDSLNKLGIHEWLSIGVILSIMCGLIFMNIILNDEVTIIEKDNAHYIIDQQLVVFVEGEVESPGKYHVKRGALVQDVLILSKPLEESDISHFKLSSKVKNGQVLKVPKKKIKKTRTKPLKEHVSSEAENK